MCKVVTNAKFVCKNWKMCKISSCETCVKLCKIAKCPKMYKILQNASMETTWHSLKFQKSCVVNRSIVHCKCAGLNTYSYIQGPKILTNFLSLCWTPIWLWWHFVIIIRPQFQTKLLLVTIYYLACNNHMTCLLKSSPQAHIICQSFLKAIV